MDERSILTESAGRSPVLHGYQSLRFPPLRASAMAGSRAWHDDGALGNQLRAYQHMVGARRGVDQISFALPVSASARIILRGHLLLLRRRRAARVEPVGAQSTAWYWL